MPRSMPPRMLTARALLTTLAIVGCLALLCTTIGAYAAPVYKWTDSQGITHFSAVPPDNGQTSEAINIHTGEAQAGTPATPEHSVTANAETAETAAADREQAFEQALKESYQLRCQEAKEAQHGLSGRGRIRLREDDDEDYRTLNEDEIAEWRQRLEEDIRRYCR